MTTKRRTDLLTTMELYHLDQACQLVTKAFGGQCPYLVGSAGSDNDAGSYRDVDVRLMLGDDEFAEACPDLARWELLCVAIGTYLRDRTGLPIDFQIQRAREANECYGNKIRNPLGLVRGSRIFAGGGDGTPLWDGVDRAKQASA